MTQLKLFEGEVHEDGSDNIDPITEINRLQMEAKIQSGKIDPSTVPAVVRFNAPPKDDKELAQIIEFRRQFEGSLPKKQKPAIKEERDLDS